jgi:SAM-dependent methyltransferase
MNQIALEQIDCPCCGASETAPWAEERGYQLVRCGECRLLYVNPRPPMSAIDEGVRLGEHNIEGRKVDVRARRIAKKVVMYVRLLGKMYADRFAGKEPLTWVDYGAGYGEVIEAVARLAPAGSRVVGVEPMHHKAEAARAAGLDVVGGYPAPGQFEADVISMVNIFSHVPDFKEILEIARSNLKPGGELFIETGNAADLDRREQFFGIFDLPDHLVFSGESQMDRFLRDAGFEVVATERQRVDGPVTFTKNVAKKLLGRPVILSLPYTSPYRQLMIRARLTR